MPYLGVFLVSSSHRCLSWHLSASGRLARSFDPIPTCYEVVSDSAAMLDICGRVPPIELLERPFLAKLYRLTTLQLWLHAWVIVQGQASTAVSRLGCHRNTPTLCLSTVRDPSS